MLERGQRVQGEEMAVAVPHPSSTPAHTSQLWKGKCEEKAEARSSSPQPASSDAESHSLRGPQPARAALPACPNSTSPGLQPGVSPPSTAQRFLWWECAYLQKPVLQMVEVGCCLVQGLGSSALSLLAPPATPPS